MVLVLKPAVTCSCVASSQCLEVEAKLHSPKYGRGREGLLLGHLYPRRCVLHHIFLLKAQVLAAVSGITKPLGRIVPGAPRHPPSPPGSSQAGSPHTECWGRDGSEGKLWPTHPPPEIRARPCSSGFFQEMAPLQHPTARGRSPQHPQGGESPAAASAGSPSPAASRKREIPGKSGLSFSSSLGGFFQKQIPKEVADVFNAPSDSEDFLGFQDDASRQRLLSEDSYASFDSLESGKKEVRFQSRYLTEELRRIFTEDTDSETEAFEGFTSSEVDVNKKGVLAMESDLSDEERGNLLGSEEEEDEEAKKKVSPKRRSFGLRVALQFPTRKSSEKKVPEQAFSNLPLKDSEPLTPLSKEISCKRWDKLEGSASESEEDIKETQAESSSALLKRAMNIKENKAMLAQLLAELNSIPDLFPVKTPTSTPSKQKKTPRRTFSEGQIARRMNPTRNARPPEKFALEKFTVSAVKFAEQFRSYRQQNLLKKRLSVQGDCGVRKRRRSSKYSSHRPVEDITEEDLDNIAITVKDKIYDKVLGSTCHQCRQKTIDTKTICRNQGCGGVRGQFCGPCLRNRYGEDVKSALLDPAWICPPCRGVCNCSYCRRRDGRCATGMLIHLAKFYGYDNVKEYLESLQKQLADDN
ncbi:PREDICTED: cell division cycle-associated 7-like protein [Aptenodytes forsteri]|uniref:cell division cycle-associated 7-like protein n=2 Tax=Aptenodytes TaxID=9232 RepID=UPI0004F41730|nr:PREDICTED: cell division cycle-associated 7-like protein [Aptenodytes forsteri]